MLYISDGRSQDAQAGSYWRDHGKSQAGTQDTSDLEAPPHSRLQGADDAAVMGTLGSVLFEGQSKGQDQMAPGASVSTSSAPFLVAPKKARLKSMYSYLAYYPVLPLRANTLFGTSQLVDGSQDPT